MKDIMNFTRKRLDMDAKGYLTITPSFFMKYFSVGCGVGALIFQGDKREEEGSYAYASSGEAPVSRSTSIGSVQSETHKNSYMLKFMIRPVIRGYIPVSDDFFIVVNAGYDYVFDYKKLNGFNFGLGVSWAVW